MIKWSTNRAIWPALKMTVFPFTNCGIWLWCGGLEIYLAFFLVYVFLIRFPYVSSIHHHIIGEIIIEIIFINISINKLDYIIGKIGLICFYPILAFITISVCHPILLKGTKKNCTDLLFFPSFNLHIFRGALCIGPLCMCMIHILKKVIFNFTV
jgi:hypothetical protein